MPQIQSMYAKRFHAEQYLTQNGYSRSFKVICFDVDEKPLVDYIHYSDKITLILFYYERWKDSDRKKQRWQISITPLSFE